jgi:hypothetical protein
VIRTEVAPGTGGSIAMRLTGHLGFAVSAVLAALPPTARGQVWPEAGDAGNSAAGAQTITGAVLTTITGSIGNKDDLDAYRFRITAPATFSATTGTSGPGDSMLFLFRNDGTPIAMNDDIGGTPNDTHSSLPAGNSLYATLPAGTYVFAVSVWNDHPTDSAGTILFQKADGTANDGTGVNGPRASEASLIFANNNTGGDAGSATYPFAYTVTLTGVAPVPEPGTFVLCGGAAVAGLAVRRRRTLARA